MIQKTSPSNQLKVSALRDSPDGWYTQTSVKKPTSEIGVVDQRCQRPKDLDSFDSVMKRAGFNMAVNVNVGSGRGDIVKRKFLSPSGSKVKPLSLEESKKLFASQSRRRNLSSNIQRKPLPANVVKKNKLNKAAALRLRANAHKAAQHRDERRSNPLGLVPVIQQNLITKVLSPREKVKEALRLFKQVHKELDHDKAARSESKTARTYYDARTVLKEMGGKVNNHKMIGLVPGIEVGDKFQYKVELEIIGLHFDIMGGIDYMTKGNLILATSIVSSDDNGYEDRFEYDTLIYTGEGGNVMSKDPKIVEDQKLVKGNLALYNSMKEKTQVRVIRGKKWEQSGKNYVYDGLYLVEEYWKEKGPQNNLVFKFKLCRVHDQPHLLT